MGTLSTFLAIIAVFIAALVVRVSRLVAELERTRLGLAEAHQQATRDLVTALAGIADALRDSRSAPTDTGR